MLNRLLVIAVILLIGSSLGAGISADTMGARDGGFVALWADELSALPEGWGFADEFTDRFAFGASAGVDPGYLGGGPHTHTVDFPPTEDFSLPGLEFVSPGQTEPVSRYNHTHSIDVPAFASEAASPMPAHLRLAHVESASMEIFPSGMIAFWSGPLSSLPEDWAVCDGAEGRPDLRDRFVRGTLAEEVPGVSIASTLAHTHSLDPPQISSSTTVEPAEYAYVGDFLVASWVHGHNVDIPAFESGETNAMPPYHELVFVTLEAESAPPPEGLIVMWTGALADIPEGWVLCDGSDDTPGLQDRFVRGTETDEEPGTTGGTSSHDHVVGPITVTSTQGFDEGQVEEANDLGIASWLHTHNVTFPALISQATMALPPFITVAFIMYEGGEVSVPEDEAVASAPRLELNYPNPFNPSTSIAFTLDRAGAARLEIFDLRGRIVTVLVDEVLPAGRHEVMWDGTDSSGRAMSSGVYLSRFEADGHVAQGRLSLVQ